MGVNSHIGVHRATGQSRNKWHRICYDCGDYRVLNFCLCLQKGEDAAHTVHAPSGGRREKYQTSYGFIVAISKKWTFPLNSQTNMYEKVLKILKYLYKYSVKKNKTVLHHRENLTFKMQSKKCT